MYFAFSEQKLDILNLKHSLDLLFLMSAKLYRIFKFSLILLLCLGLVLSHDYSELLKYYNI